MNDITFNQLCINNGLLPNYTTLIYHSITNYYAYWKLVTGFLTTN